MNKDRRKTIADIIETLTEARSEIESVQSEEQEYLDYMPESFQMGDKGAAVEEAIGYFDDAISQIDDVISALEDASA